MILKKTFPNHEIIKFQSPVEALQYIKEHKTSIHFALLDYNMEGLTGLELALQLVELGDEVLPKNNIALVSANIQKAVQDKAADVGIKFIDKPLDEEKLNYFLNERNILCG